MAKKKQENTVENKPKIIVKLKGIASGKRNFSGIGLLKNGDEVTKEIYNSFPENLRGNYFIVK